MKPIDIEFKANYQGRDWHEKYFQRCRTSGDLLVARNAILCSIDNEIKKMEQEEKATSD